MFRTLRRPHLFDLLLTISFYFLAMLLVIYVVTPIESLFNENVAFVSYLFLPHGIRIIAAMAYGPINSFIYLIFAHLITMVTLQSTFVDPPTMFLQAVIGASVGPMAIALIGQTFGTSSASLDKVTPNTWRIMIFASLVASLFNSIFQPIALGIHMPMNQAASTSLTYLVGDVLGALAMFAVLTIVLRASQSR